ncbi:MAG TPA: hypothetical protein VLR88_11110, partial [Propionibacteriaceae bacterium]|nr:hypothetical protein [Propionibacteriaceae bacterium]
SFAVAAGVNPIAVNPSILPGESFILAKTVSTPPIAPTPDIVILVDSTGSMGGAIDSLRTGLASIITTVKAAQPDAQFAIADYKDDSLFDPYMFQVGSNLTADATVATAAVDALVASGGGDEYESPLNAFWQIGSGGDAIAFREGSSRVIVWFGDAPGHDPSDGHTLAQAITSVTDVDAQVIAINVDDGFGETIDGSGGQATAITAATDGIYYPSVDPTQVAATILAGLTNLPTTVTAETFCDPGLTLELAPSSMIVPSGTDAVFNEKLTVSPSAVPGTTLTCTTEFMVNGAEATGDFLQTDTVDVDTLLAVSCAPGPNPSGTIMDTATSSGFFTLVASGDHVPLTLNLSDTNSSFTKAAVAVDTNIKLTQSPDAEPTALVGTGEVDHEITLKGDLVVTATDSEGNTATATCRVPPAT